MVSAFWCGFRLWDDDKGTRCEVGLKTDDPQTITCRREGPTHGHAEERISIMSFENIQHTVAKSPKESAHTQSAFWTNVGPWR